MESNAFVQQFMVVPFNKQIQISIPLLEVDRFMMSIGFTKFYFIFGKINNIILFLFNSIFQKYF